MYYTHTAHSCTVVPVLSVTCIQFRLKTLLPTIFTTCTRSSKRHPLTSYLFLRRSFDWKRLRKRSAAVYNLSLSTQQSKLTKYQKRVLLNANRTINWTRRTSSQFSHLSRFLRTTPGNQVQVIWNYTVTSLEPAVMLNTYGYKPTTSAVLCYPHGWSSQQFGCLGLG